MRASYLPICAKYGYTPIFVVWLISITIVVCGLAPVAGACAAIGACLAILVEPIICRNNTKNGYGMRRGSKLLRDTQCGIVMGITLFGCWVDLYRIVASF